MAEEKKQLEEKKYVQLSEEFVRMCGEAVGLKNLEDNACLVLCEDANYRLREAVQSATQFMRHAKRKKLCREDFNKALKWSDVDVIYGHSTQEQIPYHFIKEAEVFCVQDREINLISMTNENQTITLPGECALNVQWLAIEGIAKNSISSPDHAKKNSITSTAVCDDHMAYYEKVTKAILSNNEELMKVALKDIQSDSKISTLMPYFINFVCVGVKKVSHDPTQLYKLLHTVHALTSNEFLYLGPQPYLKMLVQGVLYCIIEPLTASINPINDHWALRDYAAQILVRIVRIWHTPVNQLQQHVLVSVEEVFKDLSKPFSSHYGAIVTLTVLGPEAIEKSVIPNLAHYWPHLEVAINDSAYSNAQMKADAHKVYGALLIASEIVVHQYHTELLCTHAGDADHIVCKHHGKSEANKGTLQVASDTCNRYSQLYEYFGDELAARLPYVHVNNFYTSKTEKAFGQLFATHESAMSGEELLEAFEMKEDEFQSYSGEDEHSDDDNSLVSDDAELDQEPDGEKNVDLRIKSTVNDPALGIKLTIAKLPRNLSLAPSNTDQSKENFPKKLSIKISKEQLQAQLTKQPIFDFVSLRPRYPKIDLNFEGSMPVPPCLLKRKSFNLAYLADTSECLRLHLLYKNFRAHHVLRGKSCKERFKVACKTGNVFSFM